MVECGLDGKQQHKQETKDREFEGKRPDHGELPAHIEEPMFVADPNHRKKTLKGDLYRTLAKPKAQRCGLTKVDVLRIATNYAYMMRTLTSIPKEQWLEAALAVLEHHFDNHEHCGKFCQRKNMSEEQRRLSDKIYRCKTTDKDLYDYLANVLARFITIEALEEVGHGGDTQVNESLNQTITWYAPKNKTYAGSVSLLN